MTDSRVSARVARAAAGSLKRGSATTGSLNPVAPRGSAATETKRAEPARNP